MSFIVSPFGPSRRKNSSRNAVRDFKLVYSFSMCGIFYTILVGKYNDFLASVCYNVRQL